MKNVMTIGVDLAKHVFFAVALDEQGQRVWRKKLRRGEVERFFTQQPPARPWRPARARTIGRGA